MSSTAYNGVENSDYARIRDVAERFHLLASEMHRVGIYSQHVSDFGDRLLVEINNNDGAGNVESDEKLRLAG